MKALVFAFLLVLALGLFLLPLAPANAGGPATLLATVSVGSQPKGVTLDPAADRVFVALYGSNQVAMLGGDGAMLSTQPTPGNSPNQIAFAPANGKLYVTNRDSNNLSILNATNLATVTQLNVGKQPWGTAADPQTNVVYVANFGAGTLSTVNGDSGQLSSTAILPPGANAPAEQPALAAFETNSGRLYVSGWQTGNIYVVTRDGHISAPMNVGQGAFGIAAAPDGAQVYVTNRLADKLFALTCLAPDSCSTAQTVQLPSAYAVVFNPRTNHLLVVGETAQAQELYIVNAATFQMVQTLNLGAPDADNGGQGIALNPNNDRVYVTNVHDGTLAIVQDALDIPAPTPTPTSEAHYGAWVLTTLPVGAHPKSGVFENVRDRQLYVTLFDSSRVQLVDEANYHLYDSIDVQGLHPNQITLGDKFYVTNRDSNSLSALNLLGPSGVACTGKTGVQPWGVAYNPANSHVYVANFGPANGWGSISVLDTNCHLLKTINLPNDRPTMMAALNDKVFVPGWLLGKLYVIDRNDNLSSQVTVGAGAFGIHARSNSVYMTNRNDHRLYTLDASGTDIQQIVTLPTAGYAVSSNPQLGTVYVVGGEDDRLYIYYGAYGVQVNSVPIGHQDAENGGQGITTHLTNNRVYVMNYADGTMTVIQDVSGPLPKIPPCVPPFNVPILGSPAGGTVLKTRAARLDWARTLCAQTYSVQVKQDSTSGPKVVNATGVTQSILTTQPLTPGKTYFWRVRGCSSTACDNWSGWYKFSIAANAK